MLLHLQKYRTEIEKLFKLSIPLIAGQLGLIFMGFFDNLMVGRLGHESLAAVGVANSVFFVLSIIGIGILTVVSTLVAIRLGNGREDKVPSLLRSAMFISLIVFLVIGAVMTYLSRNIELLDQPPEVARMAGPYLFLLAISQLPMYVYLAAKGVTDGYQLTRVSMMATLSALVLNVFLNWLLIYGNFGLAPMGIQGAGYATIISRCYMALFVLLYIGKTNRIPIEGKELVRYRRSTDLEQMREILSLGVPSGLQYFFEVAAFAFAAIMAGWISAADLAAHQAAITLASVTYMFATGIAAGASIKVGEAYGRNDINGAGIYGKLAQVLILLFMLIFGLLFVLMREPLVALFVVDEEVAQIAVQLMLLAAAFQAFDGLQAVTLGVLRGLEDVRVPLWIALSAYWIIAIPLGYMLGISLDYGIFGIWIGLTAGLILTASLLSLRFIRLLKQS